MVATRSKRKIEVDLDKNCLTCMELLPRSYLHLDCSHSVCHECRDELVQGSKIVCPMCRQVTSNLSQRNEVLDRVLKNHPRKMLCGKVVHGWGNAENHIKKCYKCLKNKNNMMNMELSMLVTENGRLHTTIDKLSEQNDLLATQLKMYETTLELCEESMEEDD
jgi:hypothetical protein